MISCQASTNSSIGFESVIHMGEETKDSKRAVPKAMFYSVCTSGVLGFVMLITLVVSKCGICPCFHSNNYF